MNTPKTTQSGFTLITLLVSVAIMAMLGSGAGVFISQSIKVSDKGNSRFTALQEIENASFWISRDGRMAATTDLVDSAPPVSNVTMQWTDLSDMGSVAHTSTYQLVGTDVRRTYDGVTRTLARNISSLNISRSGQMITVDIVSSPQGSAGVTKQGTYLINLRPSE